MDGYKMTMEEMAQKEEKLEQILK